VVLKSGSGNVKTLPGSLSTVTVAILLSDLTNIEFDNVSSTILNQIANVTLTTPVYPTNTTDWKYAMCNNLITTVVGGRSLTSWTMGSSECDTFMTGYCAPVAQNTCAPDSTNPAPLSDAFKACVCMVEENCLRDTFCEPGNDVPSCLSNDAFAEFIPVTCFGKNCSIEGYRWQRMLEQRCNLTLCQQIINLVGNQIVVQGGSTIYCGNKAFTIPSATVTPSPPTPSNPTLPDWVVLIIAVGVFFVVVAVPLAIVVYRRSYQDAAKAKKAAQLAPLDPLDEEVA
jgi:hypothetical protein